MLKFSEAYFYFKTMIFCSETMKSYLSPWVSVVKFILVSHCELFRVLGLDFLISHAFTNTLQKNEKQYIYLDGIVYF